MSGELGFGQSGGEKSATSNLNNIFNYSLPTAQSSEAAGASNLGAASDYFSKLLHAGRAETAENAAPVTNAFLDQADAARRKEAVSGTGRTGGTAELNREAGAKTTASIDDIINQSMIGGKATAAQGLSDIGTKEDANAAQLLGIGTSGQVPLYSGAISKESSQTGGLEGIAGLGSNSVGGAGITSFVKYLFG